MLDTVHESAGLDHAPAAKKAAEVPLALQLILGVVAILAVLIPILVVSNAPRTVEHKRPPVVISHRVVPQAELPPVEPVELQAVDPDDARAINAAVPFSSLPNPAARPFHLPGVADSRARAIDCLAAGVYYEAGDDTVGQRAVAQVIINRLRHPAFPKTVCGVVFQGAERRTGCQFTFTCDGAILRYTPTQAAWTRAREVAELALNGSVYKAVGHATHYHTDWVVPYWSASLEKISEVHTHLFFRWAGWWGTPPAFNRGYAGVEPNVPQMARLSPAHQGDAGMLLSPELAEEGTPVEPDAIPDGAVPAPLGAAGIENNSFAVTLDRSMNPEAFAALAIRTCGERAYCKFMAWTDAKQTPRQLPPSPAQSAAMSFSYLRDQNMGFAKALWNCQQFKRPSPIQCMRTQPPVAAPPAPAPTPAAEAKATGPAPLTGVRKKGGGTEPVAPAAPVLDKPQPSPTPR